MRLSALSWSRTSQRSFQRALPLIVPGYRQGCFRSSSPFLERPALFEQFEDRVGKHSVSCRIRVNIIRLESAFSEYPGKRLGLDRRAVFFCYFRVKCRRSKGQIRHRNREQYHRNPFFTCNPDHLPEISGCYTLTGLLEEVVSPVAENKQGGFSPVNNFRQPLQAGFR